MGKKHQLSGAFVLTLLMFACAGPSKRPPSEQPLPYFKAASEQSSDRLLLVGTTELPAAAVHPLSGRVGWVYRIEGRLNGQPVQYVGSAADLKRRLTNSHEWASLLQQDSTKVYAKEVLAELDIKSSNRQTLLSARNEALRAAEQRALEQARDQVERTNQGRTPAESQTRILNIDNAAADPATWEARHKVRTSKAWRVLERGTASGATKALVVLSLIDVYLMHRGAKMSRYVMAPYVLEDEQGLFTLEENKSLLSPRYYKTYRSGPETGRRFVISSEEFKGLREEAEALWGVMDWNGDFVPGLLNRSLPMVEEHGEL
jgi:hypothetical protein